jgi:hypothetical protein
MTEDLQSFIESKTGATAISGTKPLQTLWSGYGQILRVGLSGCNFQSVIVKEICFSEKNTHPRGWNTDIGHQRKLKSYQVETNWYKHFAPLSISRMPSCLGVQASSRGIYILLEDLDVAGFPLRKQQLEWNEFSACLKWLAEFHAGFLGQKPHGLWPIGTYWHLDTRPHELSALEDKALQEAAPLIDAKLNASTYQTIVHGDAKLANFCFSAEGKVAGVDFQYVGGGCGMKDVVYFTGSCLSEEDCECLEAKILDTYFKYLHKALGKFHKELEQEWRELYHVAWADFHRFLKGWSPDHWKINSYSERVTKDVIKSLMS